MDTFKPGSVVLICAPFKGYAVLAQLIFGELLDPSTCLAYEVTNEYGTCYTIVGCELEEINND
jgi:hypothetical protein